LRQKDVFIPELSLVAVSKDGKIVGQIVLYKTDISTPNGKLTELVLSPVSVHPDYFRRGIARAMVGEALLIAKEKGFRAVFLCGELEIYSKLGFSPSRHLGIYHKSDDTKTADWSMVRELYDSALCGVTGTVDML